MTQVNAGCLILLLAQLAATASAGLPAVAAAQTPSLDQELAAVDSIFSTWNGTDRPGAIVAVVRGDEVLLTRSYGMADLERNVPATTSSVFDLASVSKHFTGFALARLATEGRIDLDADIRTFLPDFPDLGHTVTPRHLIHHTGGVRDWVELLWISGWRFDDVISRDDIWELAIRQNRLNFAPGEEYTYSNTGFNLLTMIIEEVTDMPFGEYLAREAFRTLGMVNTTVQSDHQMVVPGRTRSYEPREDGGFARLSNNTMGVGSSSVLSSADDMARWLVFLNRYEQEAPRQAALFHQRAVLNSGDTISYAFGVNVGEYQGEKTVSHGGSWRGYRSNMLRFPDHELGILVASNSTQFSSGAMARAVAEVFVPGLETASATAPPSSSSALGYGSGSSASASWIGGRQSEYADRYWSPELLVHLSVREAAGGLELVYRKHGASTLQPGELDVFTLDGIRGTQTMRFFRNPAGEIEGFHLDGARFRGVEFRRDP